MTFSHFICCTAVLDNSQMLINVGSIMVVEASSDARSLGTMIHLNHAKTAHVKESVTQITEKLRSAGVFPKVKD